MNDKKGWWGGRERQLYVTFGKPALDVSIVSELHVLKNTHMQYPRNIFLQINFFPLSQI